MYSEKLFGGRLAGESGGALSGLDVATSVSGTVGNGWRGAVALRCCRVWLRVRLLVLLAGGGEDDNGFGGGNGGGVVDGDGGCISNFLLSSTPVQCKAKV